MSIILSDKKYSDSEEKAMLETFDAVLSAAKSAGVTLETFTVGREIDKCVVVTDGDKIIGVVCTHK